MLAMPPLVTRTTRRPDSQDVVRGVSVQGLLEQLLVEVMTDETGRSSEDEQTVQTVGAREKRMISTRSSISLSREALLTLHSSSSRRPPLR